MLYSKNKNYGVETVIPNIVGLRQPVSDKDYMYFQAVEDGASVILKSPSSFNVSLEISQDGTNWGNWGKSIVGVYDVFEKITLPKRGDYFFIRATDLNMWNANNLLYMYFQLGSKKISCGGNITSMITKDVELDTITYPYCFYKLFYLCASLVSAPKIKVKSLLSSYCCSYMFQGCTSLTTAPELPATTLANNCYQYMFYGCTSLTTAPELPANTLTYSCYSGMFLGCKSLTTAPELPATTLEGDCYSYMFRECTSLTTAPELQATIKYSDYQCYDSMFWGCTRLIVAPSLPSTTLANNCYRGMFHDCTSLTTAPELPATTLVGNCYDSMFYGCTSLTTAPELPATTLAGGCYSAMFRECTSLTTGSDMQKARTLNSSCCYLMYYGCTNLTSACTPNVSSWTPSYFSNWLYNVASAGTLYKPSNLTDIPTSSANGVPTGWNTVVFSQTVTLTASGSNTYGFSYSVNGVSYTIANGQTRQIILTHPQGITITTANQTDYIEIDGVFKQFGTTVELTYEDLSNGSVISCGHISDINLLSFTAQEAGSTIGMQHNGTNTGTTKPVVYISTDNKNTFTLWDYSTITLSSFGDTVYMYGTNPNGIGRETSNYSKFTMSGKISANGDCTTLIYPNGTTSMPIYGFVSLFNNCSSLTTAPELPATTLASNCYQNMFYGCTSLTTAPDLPSTTLASYCYQNMFYECTSLTTAPELQATILAYGCYYQMFQECTSLNYIKVGATSWDTSHANSWVYNVASSGVFVKPQGTEIPYGTNGIPEGWYVTDSETKTITLSAVESDCYGFSYKLNNGSVQTLSKDQTSEITITPQDTLEIMTNDVNNFRCVFLGDNVVGFGSGCTIGMTDTYYGDTITCKDPTFDKCLEFEAVSASTTIGMQHYGTNTGSTKPVIYISTDNKNTFTLWDYSTITLANVGDTVYMFGCNRGGLSNSSSNYSKFSTNKNVLLSGGVNSLINVIGNDDFLKSYAFCQLFANTKIMTAPELPATTLAGSCYSYMFNGCTSLITAPELPATTLASDCYSFMFYNCTSLTTVPELPATTLASYCYGAMFQGCTSLTTVPELPATTLAGYCYYGMFNGCTSLTTAPELPATTLTYQCYCQMFQGCTSLTTVPELPATTLAEFCYRSMFQGCTSLTTAPELPAMALANYCYFSMFQGCTSLTMAPELPATTLASYCYQYMFYGCTKLNYIKVGAMSWNASYASNWVYNVDSAGTFVKNESVTIPTDSPNGVPSGWSLINSTEMFSFQAGNTTSSIKLTTPSAMTISLEKSSDGTNWTTWNRGSDGVFDTINLASGETVYIRGDNERFATGETNASYSRFSFTGKTYCQGNIMYLLDKTGQLNGLDGKNYCFYGLFSGATSLVTPPELPATTLASDCYETMFKGCTNLKMAPELPATTLAYYCYFQMFQGCTSLTTAPKLPATTLASGCYNSMFTSCTNLTTVPSVLPATTLANRCYFYMFSNCTSLTTAPELPAMTLESYCYFGMFQSCTSLTTAPELPATALASGCYQYMFYGCTKLNYIKVCATSWNASYASNWVYNVSSTGDFYKPEGTTITSGVDGIPTGWTVHNT